MSDVGIFGAYFTCFITLPNFLFSIFNTVFFPSASKVVDKSNIFMKLNKVILVFAVLGLPTIVGLGFLLFKLYGVRYTFNFELGLIFAFTSLLIFIDSTYGWLMNSVGEKGAKITSFSAVVLAIVNVLLSFLLIPSLGLRGAVIAMIISYFFSISIMILNKRVIKSVV